MDPDLDLNSKYAKAMKYLTKCFPPPNYVKEAHLMLKKSSTFKFWTVSSYIFFSARGMLKFLSVFSSPRDLTRPLLWRTRKYFVRIQIRVANYYRSVSYPGDTCDRLKKLCYQELRILVHRIRIRKTYYCTPIIICTGTFAALQVSTRLQADRRHLEEEYNELQSKKEMVRFFMFTCEC